MTPLWFSLELIPMWDLVSQSNWLAIHSSSLYLPHPHSISPSSCMNYNYFHPASVCVCVWRGCIITVLCVFNNAGGAVGTQLGKFEYKHLTAEWIQKKVCVCSVWVCVCVCICVGDWLAVCVCIYCIQLCTFALYNVFSTTELTDRSIWKNCVQFVIVPLFPHTQYLLSEYILTNFNNGRGSWRQHDMIQLAVIPWF